MNNSNFKRTAIILNCILCAVVIALDVILILHGKLLIKALASTGFVFVGAVCLALSVKLKADIKFPAMMFAGLTITMTADIVLEIHFISGAALFALGHVLYIVSYAMLQKMKWKDFVIGLCIFVLSVLFITLAPIFNFGESLLKIVCIAYALILSLMVGKALSMFLHRRSRLNATIAIGSVLFFISDLSLVINMFAVKSMISRILCLGTYYPAQLLLALSVFVYCTAKEAE